MKPDPPGIIGRARAWLGAFRRQGARLEQIDRRLETLERSLQETWETTASTLQRLEHRIARTQQIGGMETEPLDALELRNVLWAIVADEQATRRDLRVARVQPDYGLAYTEPDPLVSIVIPTRDRPRMLVERSVPSALAQTHPRIEVVVVGDAAGPEVGEALESLGDDRIRYTNLPHRVVASDDPDKHWLVAATMARNEGAHRALGRWLVALDDDDAMHPEHVARLLGLARERHVEVAYGKLREVHSDGATHELGEFPPRRGQFAWQAALYHSGLRLFERQLVAAEFGMPGDAYLLERMLRAGVRFGMLPEPVCDYFPSQG